MEEVTIADIMRAYASEAVEHAKVQYAIELDYSEASLEHIDRMLADRMGGKLIEPDKLTSEERDELWIYCKRIGGYVGEVIIRNLGGTWQTKEIESVSACVKLLAGGKIEGSPPDSVWRTLTEPYRCVASYYRTLCAILDRS